jgi:hypothetical protein
MPEAGRSEEAFVLGPARGRDGCCRFNLRKSEEVMGIKFCGLRESVLGTVKVFEDSDY